MSEQFAGDKKTLENLIDMPEEDMKLFDVLENWAPDVDLKGVAGLAAHLVLANQRVEQAEALLRKLSKERDEISHTILPSKMDEMGLSELALDDGSKISVESFYQASLPSDTKDAALNWLDEEGHGDIIKHEVKVSLKKGQREEAESACKALSEVGLEPSVDMSVHNSTLRAFVREEIESGRVIDPSIKVFVGRRTKVK